MADSTKIAVVNHDPVFMGLVRRILESDGCEALICPEGTTAHEVIATTSPSLILLDTWLEFRESGWTLLQTLRLDERTRDIPVVLATSDPEAAKARTPQLERMGNVRVIPKPFDPESLLRSIREMLTRQDDSRAGVSPDGSKPKPERSALASKDGVEG
jgi:CheY-like chemotaxis protein